MAQVYYLTMADIRAIAADAVGEVIIREPGLLSSALARPATFAFGVEVYPSLWEKAAALLHSLTANHTLVDGNKRLAVAGAVVFLARNGVDVGTLDEDSAYDLMIDVAKGDLEDVPEIAARLAAVFGAG